MLDVVVANQRGPLLLYRNDVAPGRHWLAFELEGGCVPGARAAGPCANRSAIGAQVTVWWAGRQQLQEVSGGSGFCAQNQRRLHFGLGDARAAERVEVRWPSGKRTELTRPAADRTYRIKEPA
jgi:hypothetical protein